MSCRAPITRASDGSQISGHRASALAAAPATRLEGLRRSLAGDMLRVVMRVQPFLAALLLLAAVACGDNGGNQPDTPTPAPSPGTGVPVRGTERLAWDQAAASFSEVLQYGFAVYVDGARTTLSGVECVNSAGGSGYPCSVRLPQMSNGSHVLELTSLIDGRESARSAPLTVNVNQGRLVVGAVEAAGSVSDARAASLCVTQGACFSVTRLTSSASPLSSPAATPDGRLLFVDDERHVRVLANGTVEREPAFTTDEGARLVAVLVDPGFDRTRLVRLAWIEPTRGGSSLVVARLREFDNRLGEPAVIVPAMPLTGGGDPRVTQDDQGRIYVAMPGGGATRSGSDAYAASLVRFGPNGSTWSDGLGSPIVARGHERPRALLFDARTRSLWLAGADQGRGDTLISIAAAGAGAMTSERSDVQAMNVVTMPSAEAIVSLAPAGSGPVDFLVVDASGRLVSATASSAGLIAHGRVPFDSWEALSLEAGLRGDVFVTARSSEGVVPSFSIFRIEPSAPR